MSAVEDARVWFRSGDMPHAVRFPTSGMRAERSGSEEMDREEGRGAKTKEVFELEVREGIEGVKRQPEVSVPLEENEIFCWRESVSGGKIMGVSGERS